MNEYWGKLRWCFDEGSNTDIVDDIGVIDVLDVSMEKTGKHLLLSNNPCGKSQAIMFI